MEVFLLWLAFAVVVGVLASSRGRFGFGWFLLSAMFTPIIPLILVLALPPAGPNSKQRKCPECQEIISREATKCKHCHAHLKTESDHVI